MRNQRLVLGVAALVLLSAVVAGFVIFSDAPTTAPRSDGRPQVTVSGTSLVLGRSGAADVQVVVRGSFGCAECRAYELASRDFLRIEAARGDVRVTYRTDDSGAGEYAAQAFATFDTALRHGSASKALRLRDDLVDKQPTDSGTPPGLPEVTVDGQRLEGADGSALADATQRAVLDRLGVTG